MNIVDWFQLLKLGSNVADKLGARHGGSDKEDMDFVMAEIKISEPGLQRFRAKCALTYPTRYFSPLEDEADLVGNSLDHHSTDSYLSSSPNSSSSMVPDLTFYYLHTSFLSLK